MLFARRVHRRLFLSACAASTLLFGLSCGNAAGPTTANVVPVAVSDTPPSGFAGTFNVRLTPTEDTCKDIVPASTGEVTLSGSASNLTVRVVERGITRQYFGSITSDGSFSAGGPGTTSGVDPRHDYTGSVEGRVVGNTISGAERLNFMNGCPGLLLVVAFNGSK